MSQVGGSLRGGTGSGAKRSGGLPDAARPCGGPVPGNTCPGAAERRRQRGGRLPRRTSGGYPPPGLPPSRWRAPPGDSCILALEKLVGAVDLVVSGINRGSNLGWDVMVSGTVGAAFQGYFRGYPTIAISVGSVQNPRFDGAASLLRLMAQKLAQEDNPSGKRDPLPAQHKCPQPGPGPDNRTGDNPSRGPFLRRIGAGRGDGPSEKVLDCPQPPGHGRQRRGHRHECHQEQPHLHNPPALEPVPPGSPAQGGSIAGRGSGGVAGEGWVMK